MHLDYKIECYTVQSTYMHAQLIKPGPLVHTHNVKSRLAYRCTVLIDYQYFLLVKLSKFSNE